jgi:hypothetical protein
MKYAMKFTSLLFFPVQLFFGAYKTLVVLLQFFLLQQQQGIRKVREKIPRREFLLMPFILVRFSQRKKAFLAEKPLTHS